MINEDYCSFEVAKLLKEKGFNYQGFDYIDFEGEVIKQDRPTHQMAMKWLREVHNIYIDISPTYSEVEKTIHFIWQVFDSNYNDISDCEIFYGKYEIACEEALKYLLENLV